MSRSWTRFFLAQPEIRVGIAIGRNEVGAVALDVRDGGNEMRGMYRCKLEAPIFATPPTAAVEAALAQALRMAGEAFQGSYAAVNVVLPDTAIRSAVFELDELPKKKPLREALLRWRFASEWQRPEDSLECRGADLGEHGGKRLFFGQAADKAWLDCVRRALGQAGIVPWAINAAASYRYNRFHDEFAGKAGAMLTLDTDSWSLLLWDAAGCLRRVLTRLREPGASESEIMQIAREAERMIMAYVQEGGAVDSLYLAGDAVETAALGAAFDGRLQEAAVGLQMHEGVAGTDTGITEGMAQLAMAAALAGI